MSNELAIVFLLLPIDTKKEWRDKSSLLLHLII